VTTQPVTITRREPVKGRGTTNVYVNGMNVTEVVVNVPDRMLDTPVMWAMIDSVLASQLETHDIVMDGDVR
jgi:hypothetical protein